MTHGEAIVNGRYTPILGNKQQFIVIENIHDFINYSGEFFAIKTPEIDRGETVDSIDIHCPKCRNNVFYTSRELFETNRCKRCSNPFDGGDFMEYYIRKFEKNNLSEISDDIDIADKPTTKYKLVAFSQVINLINSPPQENTINYVVVEGTGSTVIHLKCPKCTRVTNYSDYYEVNSCANTNCDFNPTEYLLSIFGKYEKYKNNQSTNETTGQLIFYKVNWSSVTNEEYTVVAYNPTTNRQLVITGPNSGNWFRGKPSHTHEIATTDEVILALTELIDERRKLVDMKASLADLLND